jgi:hypothetical protein
MWRGLFNFFIQGDMIVNLEDYYLMGLLNYFFFTQGDIIYLLFHNINYS